MSIKAMLTLVSFTLLFQSYAQAGEVVTTVFNVFESLRTEKILVLSGADGRIYKTTKSEANLKYYQSLVGKIVKLSFADESQEIKSILVARAGEVDPKTLDLNRFQYNQLREFAPTDLQSLENAQTVFEGMLNDGDKRASQCFKRAHMWAFDMWSKLGINSQKVFIFYTDRYRQLDEDKWWFHVAPMVLVKGEEYVMDGTFMTEPIPMRQWQDYFMQGKGITCPVASNYQQFTNNQWTRLCYLMKVPMYQFSPLDIENRDLKNIRRNHWEIDELQDARRAFKNYSSTYEGLDTGKPTIKF